MKKIIFYNWIPFDEKENKGGGVTVYTKNLISHFIHQPGWRVYFLSSGRAYDFRKKGPYIEKTRNIFGEACSSYQIVNSPVFSSARISFPFIEDYLRDESLLRAMKDFMDGLGGVDVVHFQNFEGLSLSVFRLKDYFPGTRLIYSLHNYYLFCPQVMLWKGTGENCRDKYCGENCLACVPKDIYKRKVLFNQNVAYRSAEETTPWKQRAWHTAQGAVELLYKRYGRVKRRNAKKERRLAVCFREFREKNVEYANRYIDRFLAVSGCVADISCKMGISRDKLFISYIGTEAAGRQMLCQRKAYDGNILNIAYLGYMRDMKGFYFLLDALEGMEGGLAGKIGVTIAAPGTDRTACRRIKQLGSTFARVDYYDGYNHEQLAAILKDIHVGIVPVLWEDNLPQVAMEMKACGIALLCSDLGGAKELSPSADFVFRAGDRQDFYRKLQSLVDGQVLLDDYWQDGRALTNMERHIRELEMVYEETGKDTDLVNDREELVSIIVPVYNVAAYLDKCLDSICRQTYRNLEIILVDDGSADSSGEICDEYAAKDCRIRVIHQKNRGVAGARKEGARLARGRYIGFVDGDDWIDRRMYQFLVEDIKKAEADISICKKYIYQEKLADTFEETTVVKGVYEKHKDVNTICEYLFWGKDGRKEGVSINLYDKLFKRELVLKHCEETPERLRYFEDAACVVPCLLEANRVSAIDRPLYYYRQREGSACHRTDRLYLEQLNLFYDTVSEQISGDGSGLAERLDRYLVSHIYDGINGMMGLRLDHRFPFYIPPMDRLAGCGRIVVYGAGMVGKDYHRMMRLMCPERLVGWVDRQYESLQEQGLAVSGPDVLGTLAFDKMVIAVLFRDSAEKIIEELADRGIPRDKLYWSSPRTILD